MELTPEQLAREQQFLESTTILTELRKEEKEFAKDMREKIQNTFTEEEFLKMIEELTKESVDIKGTISFNTSNDFDMRFGDKEYNIKIFVKPRQKPEQKGEKIQYFLYVSGLTK